jgi:hypothetical protein
VTGPVESVEPCTPWPLDLSCCSAADDADPAVVDRWHRVATRILWRLSGMRWGPSCPLTIRPCGRSCVEQYIPFGYWGPQAGGRIPYLDAGGVWRNAVIGCGCRTACSCTSLCELRLDGPIYGVDEVRVDGVVLPPEAYRVDSPNILVRLDGECWDACQDLNAPPTELGTSAVTYRIGLPLDAAAVAAVSALTCHLIKGCTGGGCGCRLNPNITRLQRQGVEMEMVDAALLYTEGRTGIREVDLFLMSVNPDGLSRPSRVYSVDHRPARRTVWP